MKNRPFRRIVVFVGVPPHVVLFTLSRCLHYAVLFISGVVCEGNDRCRKSWLVACVFIRLYFRFKICHKIMINISLVWGIV